MARVARPEVFARPRKRKARTNPNIHLVDPTPVPEPEESGEVLLEDFGASEVVEPSNDVELQRVYAEALDLWRKDPVVFAWQVLGIYCHEAQRKMLRLMAFNPTVAVRSGQKCSKSLTLVIYALWWLFTKDGAKVFVTSSNYDNIKSVFWTELRSVVTNARLHLGGTLALDPRTGYHLPDGRFIKGFSTNRLEGWGGLSGPSLCFLIDEASLIERGMFEAIDGNRAGGGHLAAVGNPIQNDGPFFDAFHVDRAKWKTMYMSGEEMPNCTGEIVLLRQPDGTYAETNVIPGLAAPDAIKQREEFYGRDHPFFVTRVLGDFARESEDQIVPLGLVEAAQERFLWSGDQYVRGEGRLVLGLDWARYGTDAITIASRRGRRVFRVRAIYGAKLKLEAVGREQKLTQHIVAKVKEEIEDRSRGREPDPKRALVNVDVSGGGGSGCADYLKELVWDKGWPLEGQRMCDVCEVNSSESGDDEDSYHNMRTQLLFGVKTWLDQGPCALPFARVGPQQEECDMLLSDLIATRFGYDTRSRKEAESKDDVKERLKRSPDRGDAIGLCCYMGGSSMASQDTGAVSVAYNEN